MPSLADIQGRVRTAVVAGDDKDLLPLLVGGSDASKRLAIHRRHYQASLAAAIVGRFPATAWLLGGPLLTESALQFVRERPPLAPCIAEYGREFPAFLAAGPAGERLDYVRSFAELEWHIGEISVAIDQPPLSIQELRGLDGASLIDARVTLQTGLSYLVAPWPVDDLMKLFLTDTAPEQYSLAPQPVWLEVRGARGIFHIDRLDASTFAFRSAIQAGETMGDAASRALDAEADFDPGRALAVLATSGLITGIGDPGGTL